MASLKGNQQVLFQGNVIEIVEQQGKKMIKVNLLPCSIDIPLRTDDEPHLGDMISFEATITVRNVERVVPIN